MTGIAAEAPAAPADALPVGTGGEAAGRPRWRTPVRLGVVVVALVVAYFAVRHRIPSPTDIGAAVRDAEPRWVALAVAAEAVSLAMFAFQQRRLLHAFQVRMSVIRAFAVTLSRSAIAVALPAGSAVSAGFAFQQYRQRGATRATATTVLILSAFASAAGLALLYLGGTLTAVARWLAADWAGHRSTILLGAVAIALVALAPVLWWLSRSTDRAAPPSGDSAPERLVAGPAWITWVRRGLRHAAEALRAARSVPAKHWVVALSYAVANWLLDLVCLVAVARACHLDLGYGHLAATYLAVQIVRQLPITPGGIGLIETSLLAGLVSAGAAQVPAAAVVLGYRLLSCWLVIPVGLLTWFGLRLPG
ncbi:MAG TPA: lysylphosphatidylglycerol synthase transmembrane domain-containing protein, partial [Rugosimonospora sp.]|nr:lysylphosphatidylglycerol synthase transmembrane domain-containing protein [Rugosimonospora sp.]